MVQAIGEGASSRRRQIGGGVLLRIKNHNLLQNEKNRHYCDPVYCRRWSNRYCRNHPNEVPCL